MLHAWRDAAADEALLMAKFNGFQETRFTRPLPRKRLSTRSVVIFLEARSSAAGPISIPDAFTLDSAFDLSPPYTRIYRWTVSAVPVPNANRTRLVVNGSSPGPIIEANVHDRILVYLTNGLETAGTHGLPQPQTPFYDGTAGISQCPIPPGATLLYNFTFDGWSGTTWWHGHTGMQHTDGLFGPIVVHAPNERTSAYASDHVLTMSDEYDTPADEILQIYLTSTSPDPDPELIPDRAKINGLGSGPHSDDDDTQENLPIAGEGNGDTEYFEVCVGAGTTARLRLIHAGTLAPLRVSVDGHALTLIEADGTPLEPRRVREVVLQAAQRYSVLVARDPQDHRKEFWIRTRMVEDDFGYNTSHPQPEARAVLRYTTSRLNRRAPISHSLPLPTTRPGPPNGDAAKWWYALPQFDEWTLRPADTMFPSRKSMSFGDPNTDSDKDQEHDPDGRETSNTVKDDSLAPQNNDTSSKRQDIGFPTTQTYNPPPATNLPFIFSFQRTEEQNWRTFINETIWAEPPAPHAALVADTAGIFGGGKPGVRVWPGDQLIATFAHGQTIDFVITNTDDGGEFLVWSSYTADGSLALPLSTTPDPLPWLLGVGTGRYDPAEVKLNTKNPMRRDTFTVPKLGWAVVSVVADNVGYWAFHCHIAWHMAAGGLFQIAVLPAEGARVTLPEDIVQQCKVWTV
ncbi:multi-copper oxidase [Mycena leptocephala]|nr:multi-copper oxidase [Mycena leptocephala]